MNALLSSVVRDDVLTIVIRNQLTGCRLALFLVVWMICRHVARSESLEGRVIRGAKTRGGGSYAPLPPSFQHA